MGTIFLSFYLMMSAELPRSMAAFGDSMTEALLSAYSLEAGLPAKEYFEMLKIATMDDELRLDAFRRRYGHRDYSWATGQNSSGLVLSHAERLSAHVPGFKAWNFARSGARSTELNQQVEAMRPIAESLPEGFEYVVMLIGNNDLLADRVEEFIDPELLAMHIEQALEEVLRLSPRAKVLLSGPPRIFEIFDQSMDLKAVQLPGYAVRCGQMRRNLFGRHKLIFRPENQAGYQAAQEMLEAYWNAIESVSDRLSWRHPQAEVKINRFKGSRQRPLKLLSVDCFHPSDWGQAEIAESTWQQGFWPEL